MFLSSALRLTNTDAYMNRLSVEYIYAGKSEKLGSKASKYDMSVPFHLLHTKSHKNIFDADQDVEA